ncbi:Segregation and condensation protein A [hydrothermal vent metagenome]|uniref:Segregation and condensation protein A n=1 Tax=hydrothermal vent metagenome TaxID=652676 RepID=A0A3B1BI95_9ZZZZ
MKQTETDGIGTPHPQQQEMPFAIVQGEAMVTLPKDLYIPPDALEVFLDAFEGPLDLLLYLIKRQNLDILNIPVAQITAQYMDYVELMKDLRLELAGEYLLMAAMLAEIKSRMLLPRITEESDEEHDPRAELVRRLQEYERYKQAAQDLDELPRQGRDVFQPEVEVPDKIVEKREPEVSMQDLLYAFKDILQRADMYTKLNVTKETLSVRERMSLVLGKINSDSFVEFGVLFDYAEGRQGVVVTFLAILELMKESLLELVQTEPYGAIHVKAASSSS